MSKLIKAVGWMLIALAAICLFCVPLVLFDDKSEQDVVLGFLMMTAIFGFPGAIALYQTKKAERAREFRSQLVGYLRTHDRFTVEEMARKIGKTEMETDQLIARIVDEEKLDLVFHRPDRTYMHRNRVASGARVLEKCGSCGAALHHELVLEGEVVSCAYCGRALG